MKRYGTVTAWAEYFESKEGVRIAPGTIQHKLRKAEKIGITGRSRAGKVLKNAFYNESDVGEVCMDLLDKSLPQADKGGFFEKDGEKFGTAYAWSKHLQISHRPIKDNAKNGIRGKDSGKRIVIFYPETAVLEACAELLDQSLPQANQAGFFEKDGERYGSINAWLHELKISGKAITRRLTKHQKPGIRGKDTTGGVYIFYAEADVLSSCADILDDLPQANEEGFFEINGEKYRTLLGWSKIFPLSNNLIQYKLKQTQRKGVLGKAITGNLCTFYSESDFREACTDQLQELLIADEKGFFEYDGEQYRTVNAWHKTLKISAGAITRRLKETRKKGIKGKLKNRQIRTFYSKSAIYQSCAELLEEMQQANENGFFEKDGIKYGTANAWERIFPISAPTIKKRLKKLNRQGILGKSSSGQVFKFYSESDVCKACADILEKRAH